MDNEKIGKYISLCRKNKGMTQQQLADILGVTNKAVSKWETGQGIPDVALLPQLATVLDVRIDDIFAGETVSRDANRQIPRFAAEHQMTQKSVCQAYMKIFGNIQRGRGLKLLLTAGLLLLLAVGAVVAVRITRIALFYYFTAVLGLAAAVVFIWIWMGPWMKARQEFDRTGLPKDAGYKEEILFFSDHWERNLPFRQEKFSYEQIDRIRENRHDIVFFHGKEVVVIEKQAVPELDLFFTFLAGVCPRAWAAREKEGKINTPRKISCIVTGALFVLLAMEEVGAALLTRFTSYEYIYDNAGAGIRILMAVLLGGFFLSLYYDRKKPRFISLLCCGILLAGSIIGALLFPASRETILSSSAENLLIVKREIASGKATLYRRGPLFFARPHEQFPYTVYGDMKTQWLQEDVCAITYVSPDDGNVHQYVATYGVRGNGRSYDYVRPLLSGNWVSHDAAKWAMQSADGRIVLSSAGKVQMFDLDDAVQFGTTALVLMDESGLPAWTIAIGRDWEYSKSGEIQKKGSLVVCRVSMQETAPMVLYSTEPATVYDEPETTVANAEMANRQAAQEIVDYMRDTLEKDPDLSEFENQQGYVKVEAGNKDMFEVARDAFFANAMEFASSNQDIILQITYMQILAGTPEDFYINVRATEKLRDVLDGTEANTGGMVHNIRIMKGDGAYLCVLPEGSVPGDIGLEQTGMEQRRDPAGDPAYGFTVPCQPNQPNH